MNPSDFEGQNIPSSSDDILRGDSNTDAIYDDIYGGDGNDILNGGSGSDTLQGGDDYIAQSETIFTCKTFPISKALHVKTNTKPKEEDNGLYQDVA